MILLLQPVTKFPQLRAPIKQVNKPSPSEDVAATTSTSFSDRQKAFENNANGRPGKQFGNLDQSTKTQGSPKLPAKFPKSPQLPPKNPPAVNSTGIKSHNQTSQDDDEDDNDALSNMPAHLRERFRKSRKESKQRKLSQTQEDVPDMKEPTTEFPPQQKPTTGSPFVKRPFNKPSGFAPKHNNKSEPPVELGAKPVNNSSNSNDATSGMSIKDRMKMFASNNAEDSAPPKSPASQKIPHSNSFDRKQPAGISSLGKPPMNDPKPKMLPPKAAPEIKRPPVPNGNETAAVPPLPDRNTKPPKFGSRSGDVSKRPPMPLPATSYDDVSCMLPLMSL